MAGTNLIAGLCCFVVATVKLERKSGLLILWCDRELLGVSVCEWAASTLQLLKDTTGTDGHKKKERQTQEHWINIHRDTTEFNETSASKSVCDSV